MDNAIQRKNTCKHKGARNVYIQVGKILIVKIETHAKSYRFAEVVRERMRKKNINDYEQAVKGRLTVNVGVLKINNIGLARSNKPFFQRGLTGEIMNILSHIIMGEDKSKVEKYYVHAMKKWSLLKKQRTKGDHDVLLDQLLQDIATNDDTSLDDLYVFCETLLIDESQPKYPVNTAKDVSLVEGITAAHWDVIASTLMDLIIVINTDVISEIPDLHASVTSVPSLNLFFHELQHTFASVHNPKYFSRVDDQIKTLSGITCIDDFTTKHIFTGTQVNLSRPKIMFIGTHRHLVSAEQFSEIDKAMQETPHSTLEYVHASKHQLILTANDSPECLEEIQQKLASVCKENIRYIKIPVAWLILSFCIRNLKLKTIHLEVCERLARKLNISPEELQISLWFLHHCVGLLLYYPELEALKDTVICDIQAVFDTASNLMNDTFTHDIVGTLACEKFKKKTFFSLEDLMKASSKQANTLLPPEKLLKLLEHLGMLTHLPSTSHTDSITYFMPCALKNATSLILTDTHSDSDPAPLILYYATGYVPGGVFPAMITKLVSQQKNIGWELIEEDMYKNKFQFVVGKDYDKVTFKLFPFVIAIEITRNKGFKMTTETLCYEIIHITETNLNSIALRRNYNLNYRYGFVCPTHPTEGHVCIISDKTATRMECLQDPLKRKENTFLLEECHSVWFAKHNRATTSTSSSYSSLTSRGSKGNCPVLYVH